MQTKPMHAPHPSSPSAELERPVSMYVRGPIGPSINNVVPACPQLAAQSCKGSAGHPAARAGLCQAPAAATAALKPCVPSLRWLLE